MTKNLMAVLAVALVLILAAMAWAGWTARKRRQEASFESPSEALEFFGEELARVSGFYVATSLASDFLERINAYGLGIRGAAEILVFSEGVLLLRRGERPLAIDRALILEVTTSQQVIDRAVEAEGLISIVWKQNTQTLATHLRVVNETSRRHILDALKSISSREEVK
jgi:hypothetical protein